jgi:hypothetical protein
VLRPQPLGALWAWLLAVVASPGSEAGPGATSVAVPRRGAFGPTFCWAERYGAGETIPGLRLAERYGGGENHPPGVRWTPPIGMILVTRYVSVHLDPE